MNRSLLAAFAAAAMITTTAVAQTATPPISPDEAVKLKLWFDSHPVVTVAAPILGFTAMTGAVVPEPVALEDIPANAEVTTVIKLKYAKIGERIVLVDPANRQVVYVVS